MNAEHETLEAYYAGGPKTWNDAFPPVCFRSHWNPSAVSAHILPPPEFQRDLAMDPRPSTKICTSYYNMSAGDAPLASYPTMEAVPQPAALLGGQATQQPPKVFPPGGAAGRGFPYANFAKSVDTESDVLRLDEHLTRCAERRYMPPTGLPAPGVSTNVLPNASHDSLSPYATVVNKQALCRNEDDEQAWNRSSRLFFNPTKYDRTQNVPAGLQKAESLYALRCPMKANK